MCMHLNCEIIIFMQLKTHTKMKMINLEIFEENRAIKFLKERRFFCYHIRLWPTMEATILLEIIYYYSYYFIRKNFTDNYFSKID